MSMLERLRRGVAGAGQTGGNGTPRKVSVPGIDVETFEYVRVGRTALARASGRWTGETRGKAGDFGLIVTAAAGVRHDIRSIGDGVPARAGSEAQDPDEWRAAFPLTLEVVEESSATFELDTPVGSVPLDRPVLRALYMHEAEETAKEIGAEVETAAPGEPEDPEELESRAREAEAGLRWTQGQLGRERDRRRALEQELESVRRELADTKAEIDRLHGEPQRLAELEAKVSELTGERERREALEKELAEVTADRERLREFEPDAKLVAEERERRLAMERQVAELAVDREQLRAQEERVAQLGRELEEAREGAAKIEAARGELHDELIRVRAESEATITRLNAEVEAVRKMWRRPAEEEKAEEAPAAEVAAPETEEAGETEEAEEAAEAADEHAAEDEGEGAAEAGPPSDAEPSSGATPCADCDATGSCARCDGKGKRFGLRCSECGGSGLCPTCGGPGYVWHEEEAATR